MRTKEEAIELYKLNASRNVLYAMQKEWITDATANWKCEQEDIPKPDLLITRNTIAETFDRG